MIRALPDFLQPFLPFLAEAMLVLGCLALALVRRSRSSKHIVSDLVLVVVAASAAGAVLSTTSAGTIGTMGGIEKPDMVVTDLLAAHLKFLLSMVALAVVWLSGRKARAGLDDADDAAGPDEAAWAGFLVSLLGMQGMVASVHVAAAWTASVVAGLGLAQWVAGQRRTGNAREHARDLLLEGTLASAWVLLGFVLLHGLAGTLSYEGLGRRLPLTLGAPGGASMTLAAFAMVLAGFGFWSGLVPWPRSRIARAASLPLPVSAWLQVGTALAGLGVLVRLVHVALAEPALEGAWRNVTGQRWPALFSAVALVTTMTGAVAALRESALGRHVAWLILVQAGYLLLGLAALSDHGFEALLFEMVAVAAAGLGTLVAVALVVEGAGDDDFEVLRGLARRRGTARLLALILVVFLLSLAAVPPLAGFEGRARILAAVIESGGQGSAVLAAFSSVLGLLCCARVIAILLDRPRDADENVPVDFEALAVLGAMLALTLGVGLRPGPLASLAERSVTFLGG